ncbi:3'-5' exonuclease-like [Tasmannia lanceolata]|uniref:3'-5' exonuclease-like n=1 Tax=Tasmannia lanceolata TaxID=3420 RepID=UPI004062CA5D
MNSNISIREHRHWPTHRTFTVKFFGTHILTTLTPRPSIVRKWIYKIQHLHRFRRNRLTVGLGVQWRPSFTKSSSNQAATLQLCVGRSCLIFQLLRNTSTIPRSLVRFLADPRTTFVGVRNWNDSRMLQRDYELRVSKVLDLRDVATVRMGTKNGASMEQLASIVLNTHGVKKPGWIGRSNWDDWDLSEMQVQYACVDAFVSFEIGKVLKAWDY